MRISAEQYIHIILVRWFSNIIQPQIWYSIFSSIFEYSRSINCTNVHNRTFFLFFFVVDNAIGTIIGAFFFNCIRLARRRGLIYYLFIKFDDIFLHFSSFSFFFCFFSFATTKINYAILEIRPIPALLHNYTVYLYGISGRVERIEFLD